MQPSHILIAIAIVEIMIVLIMGFVGRSHTTTGTLRIDHTDPEKDIYRFEIDKFSDLSRKKSITLKIDHNADLSQK